VREPKGLPESFIEGLLVAFHGADDPAERVLSAIDQAGIGGRVMGLVDVVGDSAQR
jgi:hypothetical protein